jgi:hypothetical protein
MWAISVPTYVIVRKLPNVNNHPMGENSPNLVTLAPDKHDIIDCFQGARKTIFLSHFDELLQKHVEWTISAHVIK